jgi:hypothetical protein
MLKLARKYDYLEQKHGFREYRDGKSELPWSENSLGLYREAPVF